MRLRETATDTPFIRFTHDSKAAILQAVARRWVRIIRGVLAFWRDWASAQQQLRWRAAALQWRRKRGTQLAVVQHWLAAAAQRR